MNFAKTLIFFLSLGGWATAARTYFYLSWPSSLFLGVQSFIFVLYLSAIFNILLPGLIFVEITGLALLVFFQVKKSTGLTLRNCLIFLGYTVPFLIFTRAVPGEFKFTMSDEFPSWAANIKTMYAENSLGGISSATRGIANGFYQSYPPFQQLFQYAFLKAQNWSEANVQTAQNILVLTCLLGVAAIISEKTKSLTFPLWISAIAMYYLFGFTFSNLLADGLMAVQFAAAIAISTLDRRDTRVYVMWGIVTFNLILIKPTGFIFALCSTVFAVAMLLAKYYSENKGKLGKKKPSNSSFLKFAFIALPPVASYLSWQLHLRSISMNPGVEGASLSSINSPEFRERFKSTLSSYSENFFGSLYGPDNLAGITLATPKIVEILHISLFSIVAILCITQFILAFFDTAHSRSKQLTISLVFMFLAIFYQIFLIFLYLFFFGEYEGVRSAALVRYSSSFILAWAIFVLGRLFMHLARFRLRRILIPLVSISIMAVTPSAFANDIRKVESNPAKLQARLDVEKVAPLVTRHVEPDQKVYFIYQRSDGFEKYIFSYLVLPIYSNWACPSLGSPYYEGDVWTCNLALEEAIKGYDFLAVGNGDELFWAKNSKFLAPGSLESRQGLYRIFEKGDSLKLRQMPAQ